MKKKIVLPIILIISILTGCGSSSMDSYYESESIKGGFMAEDAMMNTVVSNGIAFDSEFAQSDSYYEEDVVVEYEEPKEAPEEDNVVTEQYDERKIVYFADVCSQTKDMDLAIEQINNSLKEYGGYISYQSNNKNGGIYSDKNYEERYVQLTIRIPSKHFDAFLNGLETENIYVQSLTKDSIDYSESYYDKEMRIKSLSTQEERLLELLASANNVETMLQIENSLADVRYEMEVLTREMRYIDSRVEYSTIEMSIDEVIKYDEIRENPKTFWEEICDTAKDSWEDFGDFLKEIILFFIYNTPFIVLLVIVIIVVRIIIIKIRKKRRVKKDV